MHKSYFAITNFPWVQTTGQGEGWPTIFAVKIPPNSENAHLTPRTNRLAKQSTPKAARLIRVAPTSDGNHHRKVQENDY